MSIQKDREAIHAFCWGCLYHFLGDDDLARKYWKTIKPIADQPDVLKPVDVLRYLAFWLDKLPDKPPVQEKGRQVVLGEMADLITKSLLNRDVYRLGALAKECKRGQEDQGKGFSRDPFIEARSEDRKTLLCLGAMLYLLRGYATIFGRDKRNRDYDDAKRALNDCFQAFQFTWRVYHSSGVLSHHQGDVVSSLTVLVAREVRHAGGLPRTNDKPPSDSAFFVWALFVMIEIMRGNVYYQTEHFESATLFYGHALKRFDLVRKDLRDGSGASNLCDKILTKNVVRAIFERSKIFFDNGLLLNSLVEQLKCLRGLIVLLRRQSPSSVGRSQRVIRKIDEAIRLIGLEKDAPVWDKRFICSVFNYGSREYFGSDTILEIPENLSGLLNARKKRRAVVLTPAAILSHMDLAARDQEQRLLADIFARIGFTLLILHVDNRERFLYRSGYLLKWLSIFFFPKTIEERNHSPMAWYTKTAIDPNFEDSVGAGTDNGRRSFEEDQARQLALRLREFIADKRKLPEPPYIAYVDLLDATTQNIGNLVTIPRRNQRVLMRHGYVHRRTHGDLGTLYTVGPYKKGPENKLVVLRRWQSYNPKLPRQGGRRLRGGGYLLMWNGKGIAIDPGYDFIQNLYDEGFSLEDIHAIVVSHSHPDHDDDLPTLLTMFHEWREFQVANGVPAKDQRKIDLLLNESSYRKFSTWLHAEKETIGRIVPLAQLTWDRGSESAIVGRGRAAEIGPRRGSNLVLDLRRSYDMELEIVPAWHDDVLNRTSAVGLKFRLYKNWRHARPRNGKVSAAKRPVCILGYTGDTGAYGERARRSIPGRITEMYRDCHVLVAHLGDARLREISSIITGMADSDTVPLPLQQVLRDLFCEHRPDAYIFDSNKLKPPKARDFIRLLTALQVVDSRISQQKLTVHYSDGTSERATVPELIVNWCALLTGQKAKPKSIVRKRLDTGILELFTQRTDIPATEGAKCSAAVSTVVEDIERSWDTETKDVDQYELAEGVYLLLGTLCASNRLTWDYQYHLGIRGVEALFEALCRLPRNWRGGQRDMTRIFVVGELPEELSSYRHRIARWLNTRVRARVLKQSSATRNSKGKPGAIAFTGDIGLHIRLENGGKVDPRIRCEYCNLNNETVAKYAAYYEPAKMRETAVKALDSRMVYLCTEKDHHPDYDEDRYDHYLFMPEVKRL